MNIRYFALLAFLFAGCNPMVGTPDMPYTGPILEVVPGATNDLMLAPNTVGAETIRFDLVNYSDNNVIVRGLHMGIGHEDASPVGITIGIRLVDGETDEPVDSEDIMVYAHSARSLVVVTDIGMYGGDRMLVTLGDHAVLIHDAEIAAYDVPPGTFVTADRIVNNFALGRIVHVLPHEMP